MITRSLLCAVAVAIPLLVPGSAVAQETTEPTPPPSTTAPPSTTTTAPPPLVCVAPQVLNANATACTTPPTTVTLPPSTTTVPPSTVTTTPSADPVGCRPWEERVRDRCVERRNLPRYDSCDRYARDGVFDIRRGDPRYRVEWDRRRNGIACERTTETDTTTTVNGDCTTIETTTREYERSARRWNDLATRYRGDTLTRTDPRWGELDGAWRDRVRWDDRYRTVRRLVDTDVNHTTTCKTPPPPVTVVVEAPPVTYTAPRRVYSAPRGGIETGGI